MFFLRDIHESMHQLAAYFFTGEWIYRDLMFWDLKTHLPIQQVAWIYFSGPLFNLLVILVALYIGTIKKMKYSFLLILTNNPLSIVVALILEGGDIWHASKLLFNELAWLIVLCYFTFYIAILFYVFFKIKTVSNQWFYFLICFILPFIEFLFLNYGLNPMFNKFVNLGICSDLLILLYNTFLGVLLLLYWKQFKMKLEISKRD